jgi:hypothetical protein
MFLRQLDRKFVQDFPSVALQSSVECAVTVDHDEAEGWLVDQQFLLELIEVELGVTVVNGKVNWLEGLEVADQFLLGGRVFIHNFASEENEAVVWGSLIEFEALSSRALGLHDCVGVALVLDLGSLAHLVEEQLGGVGDVLPGGKDDGDDTSRNLGSFQPVEELLQSEDLDGMIDRIVLHPLLNYY